MSVSLARHPRSGTRSATNTCCVVPTRLTTTSPHEPNYWWPDDRAWCVCADTDWDYHYIAGTVACIGEILRACDGS
jgi:hypothetical protein